MICYSIRGFVIGYSFFPILLFFNDPTSTSIAQTIVQLWALVSAGVLFCFLWGFVRKEIKDQGPAGILKFTVMFFFFSLLWAPYKLLKPGKVSSANRSSDG